MYNYTGEQEHDFWQLCYSTSSKKPDAKHFDINSCCMQ